MIRFLMNEELFNEIKTPLLILTLVVLLLIIITCFFVRREVNNK
jgi:hypothetical protein